MDDYISRQAAIDLLKQMRKDGDMIPWEGKDVFARIRKLPPAQPDIIRCKDCKHRPVADDDWQDGFDIEFPDNRCPCQCDDDYYNWLPSDDWFCGNAERRTDGQDD